MRTLLAIAICSTLMSCTPEPGVPDEPLMLRAFSSVRPVEVVLEWNGGPRDHIRWQYRTSRYGSDDDPWRDVPLRGSYTRTHRVTGLEAGWHRFSVRPRPAWNEEPYPPATALGAALAPGPDGIVRAYGWGLPLERGGTFRIGPSPYVMVVPAEGVFVERFGELQTYFLVHEPTGALITIDLRTGRAPAWSIESSYRYQANQGESPEEREAYELLGQIRESIRYVPFRPSISFAPRSDAGRDYAQWFVTPGEGRWEYRLGTTHASPTAAARADGSGWKSVPSRSRILEFAVTPGEDAPIRLLEVRLQGQEASGESGSIRLRPPAGAPDGLPRLSADFSHEGGHAYRLGEGYQLEIPAAMLLRAESFGIPAELTAGRGFRSPGSSAVDRILLTDERSGSYVLLDGQTHGVIEQMARPHPGGADSAAMLDELVRSIRYSPWEFDAPLLALDGGGVGEVVLAWDLAPVGQVEHWQYRYREVWRWTRWEGVPGGVSTTRHRVTGLTPGGSYTFQVRPYTATGPGVAHEASASAPAAGPGGLPLGRGLLESGRTFGIEGSPVVFDVPDGALLSLGVRAFSRDAAGEPEPLAIIRDISSGSYLWISPRLGEQRRWIPPHAGRDAGALLDQIVESLREAPPGSLGQ